MSISTEPGQWDYEAYAAIPRDGKKHKVVNGEHFVNPAPSLYHQELSRHIQFQLYTQIELNGFGVYVEQTETESITMKTSLYSVVDLTRVW